jgi:CRISPR-associated protein Csm1
MDNISPQPVSSEIACHVLQDAVFALVAWAGIDARTLCIQSEPHDVITAAKAIVGWSDQTLAPLQLVFDSVHISRGGVNAPHYRPAWALEILGSETCPRLPYAQNTPPSTQELDQVRGAIQTAIADLDWNNLAQLTLFVENFGSHLSFGDPDVALIDVARSTAAIAAALAQQPPEQKLALIGGDLMGVQKFIYTISSEGALKSLRARSFYLELATEEVVQQILEVLELPRTNVIYAGASKFYLLVAATDALKETLKRIQNEFNEWLLKKFQRKVFLAIAHETFPAVQLKASPDSEQPPLAKIWQQLNDMLKAQASQKFLNQLNDILEQKPSHQPCQVCHRDDLPEDQLKPLNKHEADSVLACITCRTMFDLGDHLPEVTMLVRSPRPSNNPGPYNPQDIPVHHHYYRSVSPNYSPQKDEVVFQINNWNLNDYRSNQFVPMLLGNYFQESPETGGFLAANEMTKAAQGIERVGYLRMDVDRLSQIFSTGLGQGYTLSRLACLSRQMTYFFKVYLNSLAECRAANFTDYKQDDGTAKFKFLTPANPRKNLLFIYAGGDDLFVSGAWNEAVEFAFDVYQAFRAYTGQHPDITLSAGVYLAGAKFPLYQAAKAAGDVEGDAKGNGRDSLGLFNVALKWDEWLGQYNTCTLKSKDREYLTTVAQPTIFGVFPFVEQLAGAVGKSYTRSFVRNLLNTAQMQEAKIKEAKEKHPDQEQDIRYYLHLPKIAYTLARLPDKIRDAPDFQPIRTSLKSPYNAPYFQAIATWIELLNR